MSRRISLIDRGHQSISLLAQVKYIRSCNNPSDVVVIPQPALSRTASSGWQGSCADGLENGLLFPLRPLSCSDARGPAAGLATRPDVIKVAQAPDPLHARAALHMKSNVHGQVRPIENSRLTAVRPSEASLSTGPSSYLCFLRVVTVLALRSRQPRLLWLGIAN